MSVGRVLYSAEEIASRIREVAAQIADDYQGKEIALVGILKGAAFLLTDLARLLPSPLDFEFVDVTSTPGDRGEVVSLTYATHFELRGKHVLIIKDVLHTGVTENYLMTHLSQQNPASMEIVALVDKPQLRSVNVQARYAIFKDVPDGHLVGFGLGTPGGQDSNQPDLSILD